MRTVMMGWFAPCCLFVLCASTVLADGNADVADQHAARVREALEDMHAWVGSGKTGNRWKEYLRSNDLEAQLAQPEKADAEMIAGVLDRYRSDAAGLDMERFVAVRTALEAWLDELQVPSLEELPELAQAAKQDYTPLMEKDVAQRKVALERRLAALDRFLRPAAVNRGWKKYLRWSELQAQLKPGAEPDREVLVEVYLLLTDNKEGLERPQFTHTAGALRDYVEALSVTSIQDGREQHEKQLDALAESLTSYQQQPSEEEHFNIGRRLGQLSVANQAHRLIRAVRKHLSQPNLVVQASKPLVAAGIERPVDRLTNVNEVILGTSISGKGHLTGEIAVELAPSTEHATLDVLLFGEVATQTTGQNGPVTLYSSGITKVAARKRLRLDESGLHPLPARANAVTNNTVNDVAAGRMASRIAWDRIAQSREQANEVAGQRAALRVSRRLDSETAGLVRKANDRFTGRIRNPLLRRAEFPELFQFATTDDSLLVVVLHAGRFRLAAPGEPPALDAAHDLSLRVHQSLVNNLAAAVLAGRTLDDEGVRKQVIEIRGSLPDELKEGANEDPWTITFDRLKPITITFNDGGFTITISGQRYTSGDRSFQAMNVSAAYKMELDGPGMKLTRQGDVRIVPPGFDESKDTLSAQQLALKSILEKKFGRVFKPEIVSEGLELPGNWKKAGKLHPTELAVEGGWLKIGWNLPQPAEGAASAEPAVGAEQSETVR